MASSLGKYVCLDKNGALSHKIGPILLLHRCRKILVWFFLSLHRWQKFWRTKLYRYIQFFSPKLCICIALNDTFLSIAAHHWSIGRSCATICISGVREYQYRNAWGQVTGDRWTGPMATKFTYKMRSGGKWDVGSGTRPTQKQKKKVQG